ncbi:MAG: LacI family DNA-binding transcriptional regulator [Armatimonadota bacterium]
MPVTISDVAKRAGVSATTVSLCFKEGTRISDVTRNKVLGVAREIGYVPNEFARRLRLGRSRLIVLIVPEIDTPFISDIVSTVEETLASDGYHVLIFSTFRNIDLEKRAVQAAMELSVEGVIIAACEKENENLAQLRESGCPVIFIDSIPITKEDSNYVVNDISAAGSLGTEYLLRLGHSNMLLINGPEQHRHFSSFKHLAGAFWNTLDKHEIAPDQRLIINQGLYIEDGYKAVEKALADNLDFSAVFAVSDWVALGAIQCLERHGFRVPEDVSVLGIDNISVASLDRIALTTIEMYNPHSSKESMGYAAAQMLLKVLRSENPAACQNKSVVFKPKLVFRNSCRQHESAQNNKRQISSELGT